MKAECELKMLMSDGPWYLIQTTENQFYMSIKEGGLLPDVNDGEVYPIDSLPSPDRVLWWNEVYNYGKGEILWLKLVLGWGAKFEHESGIFSRWSYSAEIRDAAVYELYGKYPNMHKWDFVVPEGEVKYRYLGYNHGCYEWEVTWEGCREVCYYGRELPEEEIRQKLYDVIKYTGKKKRLRELFSAL